MATTGKLGLELLANNAANQTLANLTFATLNQVVQLTILDKDLSTPPGSPADEAAYIVASGNWGTASSKAGQIAWWSDSAGAWQFIAPKVGWRASVIDELDANGVARVYGYTASGWALPEAGGDGASGLTLSSKSTDYTLVLSDANTGILHPSADSTARTFTIPGNASVAFPVGTAISFINQNGAGVVTIAITTDTLRLSGAGTTGDRTLAANGVATAIKLASTEWLISGVGLT